MEHIQDENRGEVRDIFSRFFSKREKLSTIIGLLGNNSEIAKIARDNIVSVYSEDVQYVDVGLFRGMPSLESTENIIVTLPKGKKRESLEVLSTLRHLTEATFFIDYSDSTIKPSDALTLGTHGTNEGINVSLTAIMNQYIGLRDSRGNRRSLKDMNYTFIFNRSVDTKQGTVEHYYSFSRANKGKVYDGDIEQGSIESIVDVFAAAVNRSIRDKTLTDSNWVSYGAVSRRYNYTGTGSMLGYNMLTREDENFITRDMFDDDQFVILPDVVREFLRTASYPPMEPSQPPSANNPADFYSKRATASAKYGYCSTFYLGDLVFLALADKYGIYTRVGAGNNDCGMEGMGAFSYAKLDPVLADAFKEYLENVATDRGKGFIKSGDDYYISRLECTGGNEVFGTIAPIANLLRYYSYVVGTRVDNRYFPGGAGKVFGISIPKWPRGRESSLISAGSWNGRPSRRKNEVGSTFYTSNGPISVRDYSEIPREYEPVDTPVGRVVTRGFRDHSTGSHYPVKRS